MARVLISSSTITGEVKDFAGTVAPEGYLFCRGQAISRSTYAKLFTVLGTSHGQGDGATTFNIPDRQGTFPRGLVSISTATGSGSAASNNATFTAHGINRTGFKVRLSSGTLSGLAVSTDYFAIVVDTNTLAFATTLANAIAGTKIAISGANSAVITQFEDPDASSRVASTVGGSSGNNMGAVQDGDTASHYHITTNTNASLAQFGRGGASFSGANYSAATGTGHFTSTSGNTETRPKNSLTNYIIKY